MNASIVSYSILGIGVNVNQTQFSGRLLNPSSFAIVKNKEFDLEELFNSLCSFIEVRYLDLKNGNRKKIDDDYQSVLFSYGKLKMYERHHKRFKGRISGVDDVGKLILEIESGEMKKFDMKEIKFVDH